MSHEFHIHVGCTVSICDEPMPHEPFRYFYTKIRGHDGEQLRPKSYSYIVAPLHRKLTFNKTSVKHNCHVIWHFSPKRLFPFRLRNVIAFPCSSIIHVCSHLFSTSYFKNSLSTISIMHCLLEISAQAVLKWEF